MIRLSIERPISVAMAYLVAGLLGFMAWRNIPVELLPDTTLPRLTLTATWPGASPEATEAFVTAPLESAVQQVRGVKKVTSESREQNGAGYAELRVEFARGTEMEFARLELGERISALRDVLPATASRPQVAAYIPEEFRDRAGPLLVYTVTGPLTLEGLRQHVEERVIPELHRLPGIAAVNVEGGWPRMLDIELSESRIQALGIGPERIRAEISDLDLVRQAGRVTRRGLIYSVAVREHAERLDDILDLPLLNDGGRVVRLRDVARVRDTFEAPRSHYRIDGEPAVSLRVFREPGTNAITVADRVKARLAAVQGGRPAGVRLLLDSDESRPIREQLADLRTRALVAAAIVFAVLFFFLRSWRAATLSFAGMAAALLISLNLIYFAGLSLNVLTLTGLAMGLGMIIDNGVVVLDQIYRHAAATGDARAAAERGAREMVLPVLASTVTTLVVLVPFVYLQGELRVYYLPLAVVIALTNAASLLVVFSLIPALAGRAASHPAYAAEGEGAPLPRYLRFHAALTGRTLRRPWWSVVAAFAVFGASCFLFVRYVPRGLVWAGLEADDTHIDVRVTFPRGQELAGTDALAHRFDRHIAAIPQVERYVTRVTPDRATIRVTFPDSIATGWAPASVKDELVSFGLQFSGAEVHVTGYGPSFYSGGANPPKYSIQVLGFNYVTVQEIAEDLRKRLLRFPRVEEVDPNAAGGAGGSDRATEVMLALDRERLAVHRLSVRDVVVAVRAATAGSDGRSSVLRLGGDELRFAVKLAGAADLDLQAIQEVLIPTAAGSAVRLGEIGRVSEHTVPPRILRENQQYQRTVAYEFSGPPRLGDRVRDGVIAATRLPPGYSLQIKDDWSWSPEERDQVYGALALSLLLIFMVTAALFESLRQPAVVLLSVPMALIGVFLIFFYTGATFTREAYIGVIMMGGVVVNNAILLVHHISELRSAEGLPLADAVLRGTMERVRPIVMTASATVLGLLPLVLFGESADANIWNALGYTLIGGLSSSTILILTITPILYLLVERGAERKRLARVKP